MNDVTKYFILIFYLSSIYNIIGTKNIRMFKFLSCKIIL